MSLMPTSHPPVLVEHMETGTRFLFLGTGYGLALDSRPGIVFRTEKERCHMMVCVCDCRGELAWIPSIALRVVQVGDAAPSAIPGLSKLDDLHFPEPSPPAQELIADEEPMRCAQCDRPLATRICPICDEA